MSTGNFHSVQSIIYTVLSEDQENEDFIEFELQDLLENVKNDLKNTGDFEEGCSDPYALRSYPSTEIGRLVRSRTFGDIDVDVSVNCVLRSGYYSAGNLDYHIEYMVDGKVVDDDSELRREVIECYEYYKKRKGQPTGLAKQMGGYAQDWATYAIEDMEQSVIKVYESHSDRYVCVGRASNGEAFYERVKF